ncbi:MAG: RNA polymerase sigma factor RpoH [Alphaproteobacteria bacterium]
MNEIITTNTNVAIHSPSVTPEGNLKKYLQEINQIPMLEEKEEYQLAKQWMNEGDTMAAHRLVSSHLRLVAKIAVGYRGYGLPYEELISEGNIGMMMAVKKFDPDKGARLSTYASWWIKATIQEYILQNWSIVKMGTTHDQKKLFFKLKSTKEKIGALEKGDLTPDNVKLIADELNVNEKEVISMNRRMAGVDSSLNATIGGEDGESEWQDWIEDDSDTPDKLSEESQEMQYRTVLLESAFSVLKDRERDIIKDRRLSEKPKTLEELSKIHNVSIERIRQIEASAFNKLQKEIQRLTSQKEEEALMIENKN